jgi:hypothetical protein
MKTIRTLAHRLAARLAVGAALTSGLAVASSALTACADENDPKTWVKRLDDPAQRTPAIRRLTQFHEDALTKNGGNRDADDVKALRDVIVEPMTKQYTATQLDEKTRKDLIKFLADTRDPRTAPALAKAFNEYEPGKTDEDVKYAAQAAGGMGTAGKLADQTVIDALWACFSKFQVSKAKSINLVKDLHDAVLAVKHTSYGPKAVEKLMVNVDPKAPEAKDHLEFWQLTSVQVISELRFTAAVKPLVSVLLTPEKSSLRPVTQSALLKMAKESEAPLIAALKDGDVAAKFPDKTHIAILADTIAYQVRPAGRDALIEALASVDNDNVRVIVGQSLIRYPADGKLTGAFLDAYKKVAPGATIALMQGENGRAAMLRASAQLYDTTLTEWILKELDSAKGDVHDAIALKALEASIKLMTASQSRAVGDSVAKNGTPREKEMHKLASAVVEKCKQDAACYVKVLDEPIPTGQGSANMTAIKAAWMAGVYGNEATGKELVQKIDKVKDPGARLAVIQSISKLAGKNTDAASADTLEKMVERDKTSGDGRLLAADDAVIKIAHSLRSRQ